MTDIAPLIGPANNSLQQPGSATPNDGSENSFHTILGASVIEQDDSIFSSISDGNSEQTHLLPADPQPEKIVAETHLAATKIEQNEPEIAVSSAPLQAALQSSVLSTETTITTANTQARGQGIVTNPKQHLTTATDTIAGVITNPAHSSDQQLEEGASRLQNQPIADTSEGHVLQTKNLKNIEQNGVESKSPQAAIVPAAKQEIFRRGPKADITLMQETSALPKNSQIRQPATTTPATIIHELQQLIEGQENSSLTIRRLPTATLNLNSLAQQTIGLESERGNMLFHTTVKTADETTLAPFVAAVHVVDGKVVDKLQPDSGNKDSTLPAAPRQDSQGQYLAAKLTNLSSSLNEQTQQNGSQNFDNTSMQQSALQNSAPAAGEQTGIFSQSLQSLQNQPGQQVTTEPLQQQPIPGSTVIADEHVLKQVAEKFYLHNRPLETQLNIKLHPVELGELRIDLTYKEGAIRAHVVAQSIQVQEILEKNLPRLKEMLGGQGIRIEELTISAKADDLGDFDMLQEQFAGQQQFDKPNKKSNSNTMPNPVSEPSTTWIEDNDHAVSLKV